MSKEKFQVVMNINLWFIVAVSLLLVLTARFNGQDTTVAPTRTFALNDHGSLSFLSAGLPTLTMGYARIQAAFRMGEYGLPGGFAIFANRQNGVLTSETSVPVQPLISSGRFYVEIGGPVTTGMAIANPNTQSVTISFFFTDANGTDLGQGSTTINAGSQIATFLTNAPFNAPSNFRGTFTFMSPPSLVVSAIALRGLTNERGEFLTSTLPIVGVGGLLPERRDIPHFADGAGWTTTIYLINPTDAVIAGEVRPFAQSGAPLTMTLNGNTNSVFTYSIAPRSFQSFQSLGASASVQAGLIGVIPQSSSTSRPSAFVRFGYKANGITTTEASVPAPEGASANSVYVESYGDFAGGEPGAVQSGIAIAYSGPMQQVGIEFTLYAMDGTIIADWNGPSHTGQWQDAFMLNSVPGLPSITQPFRGILRVFSLGGSPRLNGFPSVRVTGIRARYNERHEILITSTPPLEEVFFTSSSELLLPHFAVGGSEETQFVLFTDDGAVGTMYFFDQSGNALSLPMQ